MCHGFVLRWSFVLRQKKIHKRSSCTLQAWQNFSFHFSSAAERSSTSESKSSAQSKLSKSSMFASALPVEPAVSANPHIFSSSVNFSLSSTSCRIWTIPFFWGASVSSLFMDSRNSIDSASSWAFVALPWGASWLRVKQVSKWCWSLSVPSPPPIWLADVDSVVTKLKSSSSTVILGRKHSCKNTGKTTCGKSACVLQRAYVGHALHLRVWLSWGRAVPKWGRPCPSPSSENMPEHAGRSCGINVRYIFSWTPGIAFLQILRLVLWFSQSPGPTCLAGKRPSVRLRRASACSKLYFLVGVEVRNTRIQDHTFLILFRAFRYPDTPVLSWCLREEHPHPRHPVAARPARMKMAVVVQPQTSKQKKKNTTKTQICRVCKQPQLTM